jgi:hypothetical protein
MGAGRSTRGLPLQPSLPARSHRPCPRPSRGRDSSPSESAKTCTPDAPQRCQETSTSPASSFICRVYREYTIYCLFDCNLLSDKNLRGLPQRKPFVTVGETAISILSHRTPQPHRFCLRAPRTRDRSSRAGRRKLPSPAFRVGVTGLRPFPVNPDDDGRRRQSNLPSGQGPHRKT